MRIFDSKCLQLFLILKLLNLSTGFYVSKSEGIFKISDKFQFVRFFIQFISKFLAEINSDENFQFIHNFELKLGRSSFPATFPNEISIKLKLFNESFDLMFVKIQSQLSNSDDTYTMDKNGNPVKLDLNINEVNIDFIDPNTK